MQTIKTLTDFRRHRQDRTLSPELLDHLEVTFYELHESLGEDQSIEHFNLEPHGYFVVLEQGDDLTDLSEVGLNPDDRGLFGTWPEWVELEHLPDGSSYYRILILYNNEFGMFFPLRQLQGAGDNLKLIP